MSEKEKKTKRPTAKKRDIRNNKRRMMNKVFKSRIRTAVRDFEKSINDSQASLAKEKLQEVYSLMDKAVKKGIYKINKASRTKSRLTAKYATLSA